MSHTAKGRAALSASSLLLATVCWLSGCALCCAPYDDHYPSVGGAVQRSDPAYGRVGSILSDPWMAGSGPDADSNLKSRGSMPLPTPMNESTSSQPGVRYQQAANQKEALLLPGEAVDEWELSAMEEVQAAPNDLRSAPLRSSNQWR